MSDLFKLLLADDIDADHMKIGDRLKAHLRQLKFDSGKDCWTHGEFLDNDGKPTPDSVNLEFHETKKCERRASELVNRRLASNGMGHLKKEDFERIQPLLKGAHLKSHMTEDVADQAASEIHSEFPWLGPATEYAWHQFRQSASRSEPAQIEPVLLDGPPGLGKTAWSSFVADKMRVPMTSVDASSGAGQFALVGLERGWTGAEEGRVVRALIQHRVANTLVFVDEIDKATDMASKSGKHMSIEKSLLSMLEYESARKWTCPFFAMQFDLTKLSWIFASNDASKVIGPLRSRMHFIKLSAPTLDQLEWFADREAERIGLSDAATGAVIDALHASGKMLGRDLNLRDVKRFLKHAESLQSLPMFH